MLAASLLMDLKLRLLERPFAGLDLPGHVTLTSMLVVAATGAGGPTRVVVADTDPPRPGIPCHVLTAACASPSNA